MITKLNLEQTSRAVTLCFMANIPVAIWGGVGIGKSSILRQISDKLGWKMNDIRLSDKLSSDFGAPYPDEKRGRLKFLVTDLLPFDCDEKCVVFFDEYDRVQDINVQNMTLQLILDRTLNGHSLSKNARIAMAGNGTTDMGTSPLSKAAATRMCHIYVEGESASALDSYLNWAENNGISPMMRTFAKYRNEVWNSAQGNAIEEMARPTKRTFDMADRLLSMADSAKFETKDIIRAVTEGCVGSAAATELLAWRKTWKDSPTIEEVIEEPATARLTTGLDVTYAFSLTLLDWIKTHEDSKTVDAIMHYVTRWPSEQAAYFMKTVEAKCPKACASKSYLKWKNGR